MNTKIQKNISDTVSLVLDCFYGPLMEVIAATDNLTAKQLGLLGAISRSPVSSLTMTDVARLTGNSTAAATGMVDRFEKLGYATRSHSTDDRRKVMVQLTQRGLSMTEKIARALFDHLYEKAVDAGDGVDGDAELAQRP